ncbi:uncharacterized protein [Rutidosis leptorrhynchoides]|uniref:uncharacterized protein n=1 Tax=Rutidosis leptorrhynchoides TaxID=125765 RepID=UPI003A9A34E5
MAPTIEETLNTNDTNSHNHPLYLHQNDHPGLILISKKLTGSENYGSWKLKIALNAKNKLKIVTNEYAEPDQTSKELQEHYSQIDGHRVYQLANDISQLKQNNCTIEVYYHKLKGLYDEADALEAPYVCSCTYTCENGRNNGEREQRKRLIQFLMGLDESYANTRGQILLMQLLLTITKAYGMIKQEEKQREGILPKVTMPALMSTYHNGNKTNTY